CATGTDSEDSSSIAIISTKASCGSTVQIAVSTQRQTTLWRVRGNISEVMQHFQRSCRGKLKDSALIRIGTTAPSWRRAVQIAIRCLYKVANPSGKSRVSGVGSEVIQERKLSVCGHSEDQHEHCKRREP